MVTVVAVVTADVVTLKVFVVAPAATVTVEGTAACALLDLSLTTAPVGATLTSFKAGLIGPFGQGRT